MRIVFDHIDKNIFNTSEIESAFKEIVSKSGASKNVYNNRPKALAESVKDFVVIMVQGGIEDMLAYGEGTVAVSLFAQDISGFKNTKKLGLMQQKVMETIPTECTLIADDGTSKKIEIEATPTVIGDASDDFSFHARIIQYNIIITVS